MSKRGDVGGDDHGAGMMCQIVPDVRIAGVVANLGEGLDQREGMVQFGVGRALDAHGLDLDLVRLGLLHRQKRGRAANLGVFIKPRSDDGLAVFRVDHFEAGWVGQRRRHEDAKRWFDGVPVDQQVATGGIGDSFVDEAISGGGTALVLAWVHQVGATLHGQRDGRLVTDEAAGNSVASQRARIIRPLGEVPRSLGHGSERQDVAGSVLGLPGFDAGR